MMSRNADTATTTQAVAGNVANDKFVPADGPLIETRALCKTYGDGGAAITVLDGVDLAITVGEMVAIVGPSGAGKSTLLHLVAALDTPTSGTVYFRSEPLEAHRDEELAKFRNRQIGFVW